MEEGESTHGWDYSVHGEQQDVGCGRLLNQVQGHAGRI